MRPIDLVLCSLLESFETRCVQLEGKRPIPRDLDVLSMASLLVVVEYREQIASRELALSLVRRCREAAAEGQWVRDLLGDAHQYDLVVWNAIESLLTAEFDGEVADFLARSLGHGSSSIRMFAIEVAWILRRYLPRDACIKALLGNVADKLAYVTESAALARSLCASDEEFWSEASRYQPESRFASQYRDRLDILKRDRSTLAGLDRPLLVAELEVRRLLEKTILEPPVPRRPE